MSIRGKTNAVARDRILGSAVQFDLESNAAAGGVNNFTFDMEVENFTVTYVVDNLETWPSGASKPHEQPVNGRYDVSMDAGQTDGGFDIIFHTQDNFLSRGLSAPTYTLIRTIKLPPSSVAGSSTTRHQTFTGGVVTGGSQKQTNGNVALTQSITLRFDTMSVS